VGGGGNLLLKCVFVYVFGEDGKTILKNRETHNGKQHERDATTTIIKISNNNN